MEHLESVLQGNTLIPITDKKLINTIIDGAQTLFSLTADERNEHLRNFAATVREHPKDFRTAKTLLDLKNLLAEHDDTGLHRITIITH